MIRELLEYSVIYRFYRDADDTTKRVLKILFLSLFLLLFGIRLWIGE